MRAYYFIIFSFLLIPTLSVLANEPTTTNSNSCELLVKKEYAECHPEIKDNLKRMLACMQEEKDTAFDSSQCKNNTSCTRGIRNNNPGNIEKGNDNWVGITSGSDSRFATFQTPELGLRAAFKTQFSYENKHGLTSIAERINRWAPSSENNTQSYINAVAKQMGIGPNERFSITDACLGPAFIAAIVQHENGSNPYSLAQLQDGFDLAFGGKTVDISSLTTASLSVRSEGLQTIGSIATNVETSFETLTTVISDIQKIAENFENIPTTLTLATGMQSGVIDKLAEAAVNTSFSLMNFDQGQLTEALAYLKLADFQNFTASQMTHSLEKNKAFLTEQTKENPEGDTAPVFTPDSSVNGGWSEPLPGWNTSMFIPTGGSPNSRAYDAYNRGGRGHTGADIGDGKIKAGTPIYAIFGGEVILSANITGYGNMIVIKATDGSSFLYAHNQSNFVKTGDTVSAGQQIGTIGYSGNASASFPHLHLQYHPNANKAALMGYKKSSLLSAMKSSGNDAVADPIQKLKSLESGTAGFVSPGGSSDTDTEQWSGILPTDEGYLLYIDDDTSIAFEYDDSESEENDTVTPILTEKSASGKTSVTQMKTTLPTVDTGTPVESGVNTSPSVNTGTGSGVGGLIQNLTTGLISSISGVLTQAVGGLVNPFVTSLTQPANGQQDTGVSQQTICPKGWWDDNFRWMYRCMKAGSQTGNQPTQATSMIQEAIQNVMSNFSTALTGELSSAISGGFADIFGATGGKIGEIFSSIFSRAGGALSSLFSTGGGNSSGSDHPLANTYSEGSYRTYSEGSYTPVNDNVESDLTAIALKVESTATEEYRFRGSLTRTLLDTNDNLSFGEISDKFGTFVKNKLYLDLDCNEEVDNELTFVTPYRSLLPRSGGTEVLLSEYMLVPRNGLHCFAFVTDIDNVINEVDEDNNQSAWREFIPGFNGGVNDLPSDTSLPVFTFEVSEDGTNWQDTDLTINNDTEIYFRWDAPEYDSCLPFIYPTSYTFEEDVTSVSRDTKAESIDVRELTKTYAVQCRQGEDTRVEKIDIIIDHNSSTTSCYDGGIYRPLDYKTNMYIDESNSGNRVDDASFLCTENGWVIVGHEW